MFQMMFLRYEEIHLIAYLFGLEIGVYVALPYFHASLM